MKHQGPGLTTVMRQRWIKAMRRTRGLRLVVDNTCPPPPKRDPAKAIQGIRTIYGGDDGPEAA